jgi:A/G-specific adenine glycosylase
MPRPPRQPAPAADLGPEWIEGLRRRLVSWYREQKRDLPWRETADPYRILVSEVMLIQTTVAAVVPFYERFLARFPTAEALAAAPEDEVLKAWEGLGYYRRARQLQAAARAVVDSHGGKFPDDLAAIRDLPGVGRYIAGAIRSFAFNLPAPILEANTQRVVARWIGCRDDIRSTSAQATLWDAAEQLVPDEDPGEFNQAFMELGALVCRPKEPACLVCPVASFCRARLEGLTDVIPAQSKRAAPKPSREASLLIRRDDRLLLVRRAPGGLWEGFWEYPTLHIDGANPGARITDEGDLRGSLRRLVGIEAEVDEPGRAFKYTVTTHSVACEPTLGRWAGGEPTPGLGLVAAEWVDEAEFQARVLTGPARKIGWR